MSESKTRKRKASSSPLSLKEGLSSKAKVTKNDKKDDKGEPPLNFKKANATFADRRARQRNRKFSAIKTGLLQLCRDDAMYALIQDCVYRTSLIVAEASHLTSIHALRLLEAGQELPVFDHTYSNQCISAIANQGTTDNCYEGLTESFELHKSLQPAGYEPVGRIPAMAQMLVQLGLQVKTNFAVSIERTLRSRMGRWFRYKVKQHSKETGTTYFADNEPNIIKSIVSVLTRASTEQPYSVAALIARYTRFQPNQYPIPPEEMIWMQSLCDEVREVIGSVPLQLKSQSHAYLPFLYNMLKDMELSNQQMILENVDQTAPKLQKEKNGKKEKNKEEDQEEERPFKLYTLLPQKKLRPMNIPISNTLLMEMHKHLDNGVHLEGLDLWEYYFDAKTRVLHKSKRTFEPWITTDGLSASVTVSRPKTVIEEEEETTAASKRREQQRVAALFAQADRVVSTDPGRSPIFTAVVHNQAALDSLQSPAPDNTKHEVITWSKEKFYQEAGYTHRGKLTALWQRRSPVITIFNSEVQSAKTSSLQGFCEHTRHVLHNLRTVMAFYSTQRFKRLRWKTYIKTQKAYEKIVVDLKGGVKNTLIVWGDASFPSCGRGSPAVPTTKLRKKVGSRIVTVDHDEFRTSKLSCCCRTQMLGLLNPATGQRSWSLRVCSNNACSRNVWDRNVSAAINICKLFLHYVRGERRPVPFRRGNVVDEDDIEDVAMEVE